MGGDDVYDAKRAKLFAWRVGVADGELAEAVSEQAAEVGEVDPASAAQSIAEARVAVEELAALVRRTWVMTDPGRRAQAAVALTERAIDLGLPVAGLQGRDGVRLFRLLNQYRHIIPEDLQEEVLGTLSFVVLDTPELTDLMVDVVEACNEELFLPLMLARERPKGGLPQLGAQLRPYLERSENRRQRELAAICVAWAQDIAVAAPALRQMLLGRELLLRLRALQALEIAKALTADDVQALLEDVVSHPPPRGDGQWHETVYEYSLALEQAARRLQPAACHEPLSAILRHECTYIQYERLAFDDGFALATLAGVHPERALSAIDHRAEQRFVGQRYDAVRGCRGLPASLARPRLLKLAADESHGVREAARSAWVAHFGTDPEVDAALSTHLQSLLPNPPSDGQAPTSTKELVTEATEWLAQLSCKNPDPAVISTLLSAAPRTDALVLLLWVSQHGDTHPFPTLPRRRQALAELLIKHFGEPAFDGLLRLAERQATAAVSNGWLHALAQLVARSGASEHQRRQVQLLAERLLMAPGPCGLNSDVLFALGCVGPPATCTEMLWALAFGNQEAAPHATWRRENNATEALHALAAIVPDPALDDRVRRNLEDALDAADVAQSERLLRLATRRHLAGLRELAERALGFAAEELERRPSEAADRLASTSLTALSDAGHLDEERLLSLLRAPQSALFEPAAKRVREGQTALLRALEAALDSPARAGASAAAAAAHLLWADALSPSDPRIRTLIEGAPPRARCLLLTAAIHNNPDRTPLIPYVVDLLCSEQLDVAGQGLTLAQVLCDSKAEVLAPALERGIHPELQERVLAELGKPTRAELFFTDAPRA